MNYGNLAYELPEQYRTPSRRKQQTHRTTVRRNREQMLYRSKNIRRICVIIAISLAAGFMISKFVAVNETAQQIKSLQKELATLEAQTSQMVFDMEQSVDLAEIEKEATTRLGMQRPEKYQTVYVNVRQNDMTEKTAGEAEGFSSDVLSTLKKFGGNIVQFFSIK